MTAFELAQRFIGIQEMAGNKDHPLILWWLSLCADWAQHDEVPWCSATVNGVAWILRLPRSKNLRARSWLSVGIPVTLNEATTAYDVVILKREGPNEPGPEVIEHPGHVGFFAKLEGSNIWVLGGNQNNQVSVAPFPMARLLGVRRLA